MPKIKVSDAVYERLTALAKAKGKTIAEVVAQKVHVTEQFDKKTKDGLLRRVYYYQKDRYGDTGELKTFMKKWNKCATFKDVWEVYESSGFKDIYAPTFFRYGTDLHKDKLYVAHKASLKETRQEVKIKIALKEEG